MEAVGSLAGGIAHDFNNLLTVIQGYTELAMTKISKNDALYGDLETISNSAHHAAELTRQLLLFARKQPMSFSHININQTVTRLSKMLKRLIGENITIETNLAGDIWTTRTDRVNIEQVIMNMAVNARDAMPEGGTITITTENATIDEEYARDHLETRPGTFVRLSITDSGIGMNKETMQHLFEPFFTTKGTGKGTGLGLAVIYGIIKQHNGWINVYSEPGQGTVFKIYLPASPDIKPESEAKKPTDIKNLNGRGEHILLVEDEKPVLEFARQVLEKKGYVVFAATTIKEAETIFEKGKGNFHLVFSDTVLPDGTGLDLVDRLQTRRPEVRVLMSSGYTNEKAQRAIMEKKQYPFLQKPYGVNTLLLMVREVIEARK